MQDSSDNKNVVHIRQRALENTYFRQVLITGEHTQIVIMHIPAGGEIGEETHNENDQVLYLVSGKGTVYLNDESFEYEAGDIVLVPVGTRHNFVAADDQPLKIITTYSPPHHPDGTIHETKADADASE